MKRKDIAVVFDRVKLGPGAIQAALTKEKGGKTYLASTPASTHAVVSSASEKPGRGKKKVAFLRADEKALAELRQAKFVIIRLRENKQGNLHPDSFDFEADVTLDLGEVLLDPAKLRPVFEAAGVSPDMKHLRKHSPRCLQVARNIDLL